MSIPTGEKRFTRSKDREDTPMSSLSCASSPSSTTKNAQGFSKAGRRVLAELACNDSPVTGLLPAGTPASSKQKSSSGVALKSRRVLLSNPPLHPSSTPLGESLLRSQVQLLLQKVEADMCAPPCLRSSMHPDVCSEFMASPTVLAAPTPFNTPAAMALTMQHPQPITEVNVQSANTDVTHAQSVSMDGACVQSICTNEDSRGTFGFFKGHVCSGDEPHQQNVLNAIDLPTTSVSTATSLDEKPLQLSPFFSEVSDASSTEIFLGKRILHFDDDTPCKASPTKQFDGMVFEESRRHSLVRELDDDEVSEWSVHVNVGSPADKQSFVEQVDQSVSVEAGVLLQQGSAGVYSSIHEHVKKIQQESSSKVDLLWDKARERKAAPYRREGEHYEEGEEVEEDAEYSEQFYSGNDEEVGEEDDEEECDNLCDMFREMRFEEAEEGKGLPRGEGKHIRFLYGEGEDEIVEAMVVKGEDEIVCGCAATRLNGLPAPMGRHSRFVQEGEEED